MRGKDHEHRDRRLVIKYRRKGGKFVGRKVNGPVAYEALEAYLRAAKRDDVLNSPAVDKA